MDHLFAFYNCLTGGCREPVSDSSPRSQITAWDKMASGCLRGALGWISGTISSWKGLSRTASGCPGQGWSDHPWKSPNNVCMWHWGTRFGGVHGGAGWWLDSMTSEFFSNFPAFPTFTGSMNGGHEVPATGMQLCFFLADKIPEEKDHPHPCHAPAKPQ